MSHPASLQNLIQAAAAMHEHQMTTPREDILLHDRKPLVKALPWSDLRYYDNTWFEISDDLRTRRWQHVVLIDRMLRGHRPHEVLTHVPQNTNWLAKTFTLALKIERFMFFSAKSRESYLDEKTLRARVSKISRYLVRLRERKNLAYTGTSDPRLLHMMKRYFA